ncbi:MAG TPA: serine hydrolase [Gemmatimonadaceae bacterium]|nr:serine hydrolase [Gemmatimonadaceae bacterium]
MIRRAGRAIGAGLLALAPAAGAVAQVPSPRATASTNVAVDTAALHAVLDSLADAHRGVVGYTVRDLDRGAMLSRRGDETFPTASLIKVPILVTVFDLVEQGRLHLDDELTMLAIDKVPGSGVIRYLHDGARFTVRDAAWLMSTLSDNTATNLLLDRILIRRVWDKMEALGLEHTKVHAKVFLRASSVAMDSSVKYGLGVTTPNEMSTLFALLAEGKAVSPAADSAMIDILAHNEDRQMLVRYLDGVRVAHKTGADSEVRTDCGLFFLSSRVVACVLTRENVDQRWLMDNEPQLLMARMGDAIARAWGPATPGR